MQSSSHRMCTNAKQAESEAVSLCVIKAQSAVSTQSSGLGLLMYGMSTGAIRISAPLPALSAAHSCHGLPAWTLAETGVPKSRCRRCGSV